MLPIKTRHAIRSTSPRPRPHAPDDAPPSDALYDSESISIRAAIKRYELLHTEIQTTASRLSTLRGERESLKRDLEAFMTTRNLQRLHTED
jgi:hypothetical protein